MFTIDVNAVPFVVPASVVFVTYVDTPSNAKTDVNAERLVSCNVLLLVSRRTFPLAARSRSACWVPDTTERIVAGCVVPIPTFDATLYTFDDPSVDVVAQTGSAVAVPVPDIFASHEEICASDGIVYPEAADTDDPVPLTAPVPFDTDSPVPAVRFPNEGPACHVALPPESAVKRYPLVVDVPTLNVPVEVSPDTDAFPTTSSFFAGVIVPTPTLPAAVTLKFPDPTWNCEAGAVVATPTFPSYTARFVAPYVDPPDWSRAPNAFAGVNDGLKSRSINEPIQMLFASVDVYPVAPEIVNRIASILSYPVVI